MNTTSTRGSESKMAPRCWSCDCFWEVWFYLPVSNCFVLKYNLIANKLLCLWPISLSNQLSQNNCFVTFIYYQDPSVTTPQKSTPVGSRKRKRRKLKDTDLSDLLSPESPLFRSKRKSGDLLSVSGSLLDNTLVSPATPKGNTLYQRLNFAYFTRLLLVEDWLKCSANFWTLVTSWTSFGQGLSTCLFLVTL